ncbi:HDOD domain-containing protein [Corallincola platygyrae]|uniref:HDOD domain-containing protein n=1 Tax=Corallincola platygyrae TaxID=1193278 RepID=A0ABW4XRV0_9GAMM
MSDSDKSLHIKHPDTLYQGVYKLFVMAEVPDRTGFAKAALALAKSIYHGYPVDAPVMIAHLSLHNHRYALSVNEALNCAILTCALCYQRRWPAQLSVPLIAAALTRDISHLAMSDSRFDGTRFTDEQANVWLQRGQHSAEWLKQAGVKSYIWLRSVQLHNTRMNGKGTPALAGYQINPAARLLAWCSFFAEQICPRENRSGLRPRQIIRYAIGRGRLAFDRDLVNLTARIFAPIQPGAVIKTDDEQLAIVIGRQNRNEALITSIEAKDLSVAQCNVEQIVRRYPTQLEKGRHFLARIIRGWQQMQAQSVVLLDGLKLPRQDTLSPEEIAEAAYFFNQEEPSVNELAKLLERHPALQRRMAKQASLMSKRQRDITDAKQTLMMLGLKRAAPLVQRSAILMALDKDSGPYLPSMSTIVENYSGLASLLADATRFADPEKIRVAATVQCSGLHLAPEMYSNRPKWHDINAENPSGWFKSNDPQRLSSLGLAFASRWQLPEFTIHALTLAADRASPNASRKAMGYAYLLRLTSLLFSQLWVEGEQLQHDRLSSLMSALHIEQSQIAKCLTIFTEKYHPHCSLD